MKKLSKKTITGLGLTFGVAAVGTFMVVINSYKPVNSYANKAFNKKTLSHAEQNIEETKNEVEQDKNEMETVNKEVEISTSEVAVAAEKVKATKNEVTVAEQEEKEAEKQLEEAQAELEAAETEEAKEVAQAKVTQATQAKEAAHNKVEEANEAATKATEELKAAEEVQRKEEQNSTVTNEKAEESNSKTTNSQENKTTEEKNNNAINTIMNAAKKTQDANSLTVYDITNKWAKQYNKINGNELITYYSGSTASNGRSGVLYSYTSKLNHTTSQKSLFKPMNTSIWTIPGASSIKGDIKVWEMQFSGTRTVGVPELELLQKGIESANLDTTAATLVTKSANVLLKNVSYYKVTISEDKVINWLTKYYNVNDATAINNDVDTESVEVIVGVSNGYITYISNVNNNDLKGFQIMTGENGKFTAGKYLKFEVVLTKANSTSVPTLAEVGLDETSVAGLEEEYKAHYGCKKEWTSSEKYGEYYYWVCRP